MVVEQDFTSTRDAYLKKVKESVKEAKKSILYTAKHWRVDAELIRLLEQKVKEGLDVRALGPVDENSESINWLKSVGVKIKDYKLEETHFCVYDKSMIIISLRKEPKKENYSAVWMRSEMLGKVLFDYFNKTWQRI